MKSRRTCLEAYTRDIDKTTLQQPQKRVGALPWCHPGHPGTPVGPGKDTHGTLVPERERRGWPTTRSTVRQACTTKRQTPLSSTTYSGSGAVLSRRVGQEADGQFVGSRSQQRQRTQGNTPGWRTRFKSEEFIDKVQNEE